MLLHSWEMQRCIDTWSAKAVNCAKAPSTWARTWMLREFGHGRHGANPGKEEQEDACVRRGDDLRTPVERLQH